MNNWFGEVGWGTEGQAKAAMLLNLSISQHRENNLSWGRNKVPGPVEGIWLSSVIKHWMSEDRISSEDKLADCNKCVCFCACHSKPEKKWQKNNNLCQSAFIMQCIRIYVIVLCFEGAPYMDICKPYGETYTQRNFRVKNLFLHCDEDIGFHSPSTWSITRVAA